MTNFLTLIGSPDYLNLSKLTHVENRENNICKGITIL